MAAVQVAAVSGVRNRACRGGWPRWARRYFSNGDDESVARETPRTTMLEKILICVYGQLCVGKDLDLWY